MSIAIFIFAIFLTSHGSSLIDGDYFCEKQYKVLPLADRDGFALVLVRRKDNPGLLDRARILPSRNECPALYESVFCLLIFDDTKQQWIHAWPGCAMS